jgi:glycosyltransferase involved in cell wall biosynthesis
MAEKPLRLLVTTDLWFPDYVGGTARVARETAVGLARRGHEVTVVAPRKHGLPEAESVDGVRVERAVTESKLLPRTVMYAPRFYVATRRRVRKFDVVVAHHASNAAGMAALRQGCPLAYVFHASPRLESEFRRSRGVPPHERLRARLVEPLSKVVERTAARRADRVLVLSEFSRGILEATERIAPDRIMNVGGGVDTRTFVPAANRQAAREALGIPASSTALVTTRRLVNRMGVDRLVLALDELKEVSDLHLYVIGDGEERTRLMRLALERGLDKRITFLGRVSDESLLAWYQSADLFVLPTAAYEGFGMVTAEALACGTPVLGTPVGATPELLAPLDPRLIAEGADASSIARAVRDALPLLDDELRHRCRLYAEEHLSWEGVLDAWEAALAGIARDRRAA